MYYLHRGGTRETTVAEERQRWRDGEMRRHGRLKEKSFTKTERPENLGQPKGEKIAVTLRQDKKKKNATFCHLLAHFYTDAA